MRRKASEGIMKIVYHLGAHGTEEELILRVLLRNRPTLAQHGVVVPAPSRYRPILHEAIRTLRGTRASPAMQEAMMDAILEEDAPQRIILSHENFLSTAVRSIGPGGLYPFAGQKPMHMAHLFPDIDCEFHLALRHPAALLMSMLQRLPGASYEQMMEGVEPLQLRWAPMLRQFVSAAAGRPVVLWCHEDAPLIWPEIIRRMAGIGPDVPIMGNAALLGRLLTREGMDWLNARVAETPPATIGERRDLVSQALMRFANPAETEQQITFPGWTTELVEDLDDLYDDDVAEVAALPGVEFIAP
ncbi:hypothetical protein ACEYYB_09080 [Paracoccus sp. p4-l81]|uniref:hypothetical protein n=1 Tax=unclassified Paracoccus (in: a-proteobacteria) TaxID=2688777 RepID=UPI0035B962E8